MTVTVTVTVTAAVTVTVPLPIWLTIIVQDTVFYRNWDICQIAKMQDLHLIRIIPFTILPGYRHSAARTAVGGKDGKHFQNAYTFCWSAKPVAVCCPLTRLYLLSCQKGWMLKDYPATVIDVVGGWSDADLQANQGLLVGCTSPTDMEQVCLCQNAMLMAHLEIVKGVTGRSKKTILNWVWLWMQKGGFQTMVAAPSYHGGKSNRFHFSSPWSPPLIVNCFTLFHRSSRVKRCKAEQPELLPRRAAGEQLRHKRQRGTSTDPWQHSRASSEEMGIHFAPLSRVLHIHPIAPSLRRVPLGKAMWCRRGIMTNGHSPTGK